MALPRSAIEPFADQKTAILTSYRRDGTPVDTPVHVAVDGDWVFIRTYSTTFKIRRLRRNPEAELWLASNGTRPALMTLSNPRSVRRADYGIRVRARLLEGEDSRRAATALARKYPVLHGFLIPWLHRHWYHAETVNAELTPVSEAAAT
jgi:PPOX class probable F420-dependent enzyme